MALSKYIVDRFTGTGPVSLDSDDKLLKYSKRGYNLVGGRDFEKGKKLIDAWKACGEKITGRVGEGGGGVKIVKDPRPPVVKKNEQKKVEAAAAAAAGSAGKAGSRPQLKAGWVYCDTCGKPFEPKHDVQTTCPDCKLAASDQQAGKDEGQVEGQGEADLAGEGSGEEAGQPAVDLPAGKKPGRKKVTKRKAGKKAAGKGE